MRSVRLKARCRIGIGFGILIKTDSVASARPRDFDKAAKVTVRLPLQRMIPSVDDDAKGVVIGSPDPEVGAGGSQFGADGAPSRVHREEHECKPRATAAKRSAGGATRRRSSIILG